MTRRPICSPTEQRKALSMYRRFKTDSREYKQLAESLNVNTAELNSYCWHLEKDARDKKEREKAESAEEQKRLQRSFIRQQRMA
jgi:hypothetical protein